jgi:hypothetical protein
MSSLSEKELNELWADHRDKLSPEEYELFREVVRDALDIGAPIVPANRRYICGKCSHLRNECMCSHD